MLRTFQDYPLNRKLTAITMLTTVAAIVLASAAIVTYQLHSFTRFIVSELDTTADILGANGAVALRFNVPRDAENTLATVRAKEHINGACFFTTNEELFAEYSREGAAKMQMPQFPAEEGHRITFTENKIVLIKRIDHDGDFIGTVHVQSDLDAFYEQLMQSIAVTLLAIVSCSSLALWLAYKSLRVVSQPITNLVDVAMQVSETKDYGLRAQKLANDELGILTDEFNDMLYQIQLRDVDLQQANAEREQRIQERVDKRTAELDEANQQLNQEIDERQQAEAASHMKSAFLANMSHEFRTPMGAIIGMTDLVLQGDLSATQRSHLETVEGSAAALLLLLNDVLDSSKIEAGELALERIPFPLNDNLAGTVKSLALKAHQKELELAFRIVHDVPDQLLGDPTRLRQIVMNLLSNAIKFTDQGEVTLAVILEARRDDEVRLGFSVSDTGMGIPSERREQIFATFSQADVSTARQYGGTGLGLGIARQLVEIMGGILEVESEVEKGSTFRFAVPFGLPEATVMATHQTAPADLSGKRVLVGDNSATNRLIMQEALSSWEMTVTCVEDGYTALQALQSAGDDEQFDVVCLDTHTPQIDGFEVARRIREPVYPADLLLIMLTSADYDAKNPRSAELGIDCYLSKPIVQSELYDALCSVFGSVPVEGEPFSREEQFSMAARPLRILLAEDTVANQHLVEPCWNRKAIALPL